jgi:hypothetical protein
VTYSVGGLPNKPFKLNAADIRKYDGTLYVNLSNNLMWQGSFKTAHPGMIKFNAKQLKTSPFAENRVCAKQMYQQNEKTGAIM